MPATELETYFLELVNATRAEAGLPALTFDEELLNAADDHSAWMDATDTLSHTGANGSSPEDRIAEAGYEATHTGENIWYYAGTDEETGQTAAATTTFVNKSHQWFLNSPGHYQNVVSSDFQEIGISVVEGDYQDWPAVFVTQVYGTPAADEQAEADSIFIA
jgi:serralysin